MTVDDLPEPARARLTAILARSPADWQAGKVTSGAQPASWVIELRDGVGELMGTAIVTVERQGKGELDKGKHD